MRWQHNTYALLMLAAAIFAAANGAYAWRKRGTPGARTFALAMLGLTAWALGSWLQLASADLRGILFWSAVQYVGVVSVPTAWLCLALRFTGRGAWLTWRSRILLGIVPAAVLLLVWTNPFHSLYWSEVGVETRDGLAWLAVSRGPAYWANLAYSYLLVLLGSVLLLHALVRSSRLHRGQAQALLLAVSLPWASNVLFQFGWPAKGVDLTPAAFALSGLAFGWSLFRYGFLDIVPVARAAVVEALTDGLIVLDVQNRIVDLNQAARGVLGDKAADAIGRPAAEVLSAWRLFDAHRALGETQSEIRVSEPGAERHYEVRASLLYERPGRLSGCLVVLRDVTRRKRAEWELRLLAHALRSTDECVTITDSDDKLLFVNDAFVETYGYERRELIGRPITVLGSPNNPPELVAQILTATIAGGWRGELLQRRKDGTEFPSALATSIVHDESGRPIAFIGVSRDITDRRRAEEALQRSEARYRQIVETSSDIISRSDMSGRFTYGSPVYRRILGFAEEEMLGKKFYDFVRPDHRERAVAFYRNQLATRTPSTYLELPFIAKDGTEVWTGQNTQLLTDGDEVVGFQSVSRDITERRRAEEALARSEAQYRQIVETASDMISKADMRGRFTYVSPVTQRILGFTEEEMLGRNVYDFVRPDHREPAAAFYRNQLATRTPSTYLELPFIAKDGTEVWTGQNTQLLLEGDAVVGFQSVSRDVTERKRAEEELAKSEARYRELVERASDIVVRFDTAARFAYVNPAGLRVSGYTEAELIGRNYLELVRPDCRERTAEFYAEQYWNLIPNTYYEWPMIAKDGREVWLGQNVQLVLEHGVPAAFQGLARDITERKRAEEALAASEARYRQIVETASDVISKTDMGGRLTYVSPVTQRILGFAEEEMLGRNVYDFVRPDHREPAAAFYVNQLATRTPSTYLELPFIAKDGTEVWSGQNTQLLLEGDEVVGFQSVSRDITDRKRAEEELARSQARYRELVERASDIVIRSDPMGHLTYVNPVTVRLTGYSEAELIGKSYPELVRPDWQEKAAEFYLNQFLNAVPSTYLEFPLITKDGRELWLGQNAQLLFEHDTPVGFQGQLRDITERRRAEEALQRSETRYRQIVENVNDIIARTDTRGRFTYVNPGFVRILGFSEEEALGREFVDIVRPDRRQEVGAFYRAQFSERIQSTYYECPALAKDGREVWLGQNTQLLAEGDRILGYQSVGRDITERKQAEEALARANADLEEAARLAKELAAAAEAASVVKSRFLANMSHELRTPLNAILGFVQVMQRDRERSRADREHLEIVSRSGEHLLGLINDVLSLSKIEAGQEALSAAPFDLPRMLLGLEEMFRERSAAKGLELRFELAADLPRHVVGDEGKLRQVLINLLGNAVKFTGAGRVALRARRQDGRVGFEVEDTGPGIGADERELLFAPFTQAEAGQRTHEGTGLGLAISRSYVRLMGGDVQVQSEPGRGSLFSFEAELRPAAEAELPRREAPRVLGIMPGPRPLRILVADDSTVSRMLLVKLLSLDGMEVGEAANGQEALASWRASHPDIVFMDMRMPVMDGLDATRRLRAEEGPERRTKVVAVTASAFEDDERALLEAGCDDMLRKPVTEAALFEALARHTGVGLVHDEPVVPASAGGVDALTPERLATLPAELRLSLAEALQIGDDQKAGEVVERIRPHDPSLADALGRAVRSCDLERLLTLMDRIRA